MCTLGRTDGGWRWVTQDLGFSQGHTQPYMLAFARFFPFSSSSSSSSLLRFSKPTRSSPATAVWSLSSLTLGPFASRAWSPLPFGFLCVSLSPFHPHNRGPPSPTVPTTATHKLTANFSPRTTAPLFASPSLPCFAARHLHPSPLLSNRAVYSPLRGDRLSTRFDSILLALSLIHPFAVEQERLTRLHLNRRGRYAAPFSSASIRPSPSRPRRSFSLYNI